MTTLHFNQLKQSSRAIILIFMFLLGSMHTVFAQSRPITGRVIAVDTKETLPGATILIKGTAKGTSTDIDGKFSLQVNGDNTVLVVSFIGFETKEIAVGRQSILYIEMQSSKVMLSELVVVGYGTVRKSDLTGSVGSIKSKELSKVTSLNPEQSLQGKVAGVQVASTSGAPGATPMVRIRGVGTFNNSAPIYVVDGVILDNISFLNSADIASMEILRDASSTAMYGSRGANGVILITTKSGKMNEEKTSFTYSGEYSIQSVAKKIDLLNGREFATIANEIPGDPNYNNLDAVPNTDWQSLIFRTAPINSHQFSASGASKKSTFYVGVSYFNQKGIIEKSGYERVTLKLNNTYNLTDNVRFGNNITISPYKQQNAPDVVFQAYRAWPTLEPYRADGSFAGVQGVGNPLASIAYNNSFNKGIRGVGNLYSEATFLKEFVVKTSLGIDAAYNKNENFSPAYTVLYYDGSESMQKHTKSSLSKGSSDNMTWLWENTLNYNHNFGKHAVNAVVGYTMQNTTSENLDVSGENIIRDGSDFWYLQYTNITGTGVNGGL